MADGDPLPSEHHTVRYCKPSQATNGAVLGAAFVLEPGHAELSVTCIQLVTDSLDRMNQFRAVRSALDASRLNVKPNGWLAAIQVGQFTSLTELLGTALALVVRHYPVDGNPGHSGVHGMPATGAPLATALGVVLAGRVDGPPVRVRAL